MRKKLGYQDANKLDDLEKKAADTFHAYICARRELEKFVLAKSGYEVWENDQICKIDLKDLVEIQTGKVFPKHLRAAAILGVTEKSEYMKELQYRTDTAYEAETMQLVSYYDGVRRKWGERV